MWPFKPKPKLAKRSPSITIGDIAANWSADSGWEFVDPILQVDCMLNETAAIRSTFITPQTNGQILLLTLSSPTDKLKACTLAINSWRVSDSAWENTDLLDRYSAETRRYQNALLNIWGNGLRRPDGRRAF